MLTVWRKLRWSIAQRGVAGTLRALPHALARRSSPAAQHPFDTRYGTDTGGVLGGGSLAVGHAHDVHITGYAGISPSRFEAAIKQWSSAIGSSPAAPGLAGYSFIDLGCGKGRALLLASRFPFREVIGIELNPQLAAIAKRNVERWQSSRECRSSIGVHLGDAADPPLPNTPTLLFLYNAFAEPLVRQLATRLSSAALTDRTVDLIYQNAYFAHVFTQQLGFRELWRGVLPLSPEDAASDPVASPDDLTVILRCTSRIDASSANCV